MSTVSIINEQFRSFSISLPVPVHVAPTRNTLSDVTWEGDGVSSSRAHCSRLSHCELDPLDPLDPEDAESNMKQLLWLLMLIEERSWSLCTLPVRQQQQQRTVQMRTETKVMVWMRTTSVACAEILQPSCVRTIKSPGALEPDAADAKWLDGNHLKNHLQRSRSRFKNVGVICRRRPK